MKKMIDLTDDLNKQVKIAAIMNRMTENKYMITAIANQLKADAAPAKGTPTKEEPTKEEPGTGMSTGNIRTGEPIKEHINAGRFLQQKHHPKGILSNGECLKRGDVYKYFVEEFPAEEIF